MKYIIALDGGNTQIKAVLFDLRGEEINKVLVENDVIVKGECRELNMLAFWEKAAAAVYALMAEGPARPEDIVGIGLTGSPEGLWAVGHDGKPVGNAILGIDGRAREEAAYVREKTPGMGKLIHRNLGCPVNAGSPLMILRWLRKNRLDQYRRIKVALMAKDWLRYCMTGRMVTDFSDGVAAFLRFPTGRIPSQMLTVLELRDAVGKLPGVLDATVIAGRLGEDAADQMGLAAGIPVAVGAMDMVSAALGVGAIDRGDVAVILGKAPAAMTVHEREICDPTRYWQHFLCHVHDDCALELMATLDIAANIEWALKELTGSVDYALADQLVEQAAPGSGGVVFLPYLSTQRERVVRAPKNATGCFFGMTEATTKQEMLRAVYESVAYALRDISMDARSVKQIRLSDGAAAGGLLPRIIADVMDATVAVASGSAFAAKGAAMTCGIGLGIYQNCEDAAKRCCGAAHQYQPRPKPIYQSGFMLYRDLRRTFGDLWQERERMMRQMERT